MAITLDGTTGITTPGLTNTGTTTIVALTTTGNTTLGDATSDTLTVGVTGIVKDASGNVGIGTASPTNKLDVSAATGVVNVSSTTGTNIAKVQINNAAGSFQFAIEDSAGSNYGVTAYSRILWNDGAYPTVFFTNGTERMRITSGGYVLVGTTTVPSPSGILGLKNPSHATIWGSGPDTNGAYLVYNSSNVGVYLGSGNTAWSSSSDERIKTAITPFENALEKVCTLRAGTGRYFKDEETVSRSLLIAQDVQAVLPEAVNVQNDEIGTLGLQYTDVIPLLVAAIKEQQALITALTARITALETP